MRPARICTLAVSFALAVAGAAEAPLAARDLLLDIAAAEGRMVVVGARGHILHSADGRIWHPARVPVDVLLTAVALGPGGLGWAVGHDAVVLRSTDGGRSWVDVYADAEDSSPLLDVWMDSEGIHGIAVGAYSRYLVTRDGGRHWAPVPFPVAGAPEAEADPDALPLDVHLNAIREAPSGALYLAAEAGHVFRSDDRGASWMPLPSPYVGSFFGVLPLEDDVVLVFGLRGHLYRSTDGGRHWARVQTGTQEMLTDGIRLQDGRLLLVGLGGVVLVSRDGGRTFTLRVRPDRAGLSAVLQRGDGRVFAVGEKGVVELERGWLEGPDR